MEKIDTQSTSDKKNDTSKQTEPHQSDNVKKNKSTKFLLIIVAVLVVVGGIWWYVKGQAKPVVQRNVKIGVMTALTGSFTNGGTAVREGVEFAAKEHPMEGLNVTFSYKDSNCEGPKAEQAAKDLAAEGVVAIVGDLCSSATLAAIPIATENKIPMISGSSTNPKLSQAGAYFFRTIPSDAFAAKFTADLIFNKYKISKLAIFHENDPYGTSLNQDVTAEFEKLGGKVVDSQSFAREATNVTKQITHIKASNPEAVYMVSVGRITPTAALFKMKELGLNVPVFASESLFDVTFIQDTGKTGEGVRVVAVSQGTPAYIEKHNGAFGNDPAIYNAQAYDAYTAIFEALKTGATTGEEIAKALRAVEFQGASGYIRFDERGDVAPNFTVYKIVDGKFRAEN